MSIDSWKTIQVKLKIDGRLWGDDTVEKSKKGVTDGRDKYTHILR